MDVVSYRGPGKAGGVSVALARVWNDQSATAKRWWHLEENSLVCKDHLSSPVVARLPKETVSGHYRYCNEFLWPVMHDLPQYAIFRAGDRRYYQQFNLGLAEQLERSAAGAQSQFFIQDYQLALIPSMMAADDNIECAIFWHIPWPKTVLEIHVAPMLEVARALLSASTVGFHTREYATSFLRFVETHLPGCRADYSSLTVEGGDLAGRFRTAAKHAAMQLPTYVCNGHAQVVVAPLGLDVEYWRKLVEADVDVFADPRFKPLEKIPFVLSVDRADYTKGVLERIQSIDCFFEKEPERAGNVTFLQICGRTRPGMPVYDAYWQKCRQAAQQLQQKWSTSFWQPLIWIDSPVSCEELAALYCHADVMLVNPLKDGLNLTAKEFIVCQQEQKPGVLVLSAGAGAWYELGNYCLPANPFNADELASATSEALNMPVQQRRARLELLKDQLRSNGLDAWFTRFYSGAGPSSAVEKTSH